MDPASWERLKGVIPDALERPPGERQAFVPQRCADPVILGQARGRLQVRLHVELRRPLRRAGSAEPWIDQGAQADGAYLYRINDVVGVGGAAGYMPVWGERFPETQSRALLTANMIVYPFATHPKWRAFAIRPEFNWVPRGVHRR
jgi:hypothetical protein